MVLLEEEKRVRSQAQAVIQDGAKLLTLPVHFRHKQVHLGNSPQLENAVHNVQAARPLTAMEGSAELVPASLLWDPRR